MNRPLIVRGLRIAVSAVFGILCILLITVWNLDGGTYVNGNFPGVSRFVVTSYCFGETLWKDTVSAYAIFGLHAQNDSQWEVGHFSAIGGGLPEGFAIRIDAGQPAISVDAPHWFLVLLCVSGAIIPWTPAISGAWRFSLRSLLIAVTLIAAVLGIIAVASR